MSQRVDIETHHGASKLSGLVDHLHLIKDRIEYSTKMFRCSDKGRVKERVEENVLCDVNDDEQLVVPTGLIPAVSDRLRQAGVDVTETDCRRFPDRQKMSKLVMKNASDEECDFFQALWGKPLGQIEVGRPGEIV